MVAISAAVTDPNEASIACDESEPPCQPCGVRQVTLTTSSPVYSVSTATDCTCVGKLLSAHVRRSALDLGPYGCPYSSNARRTPPARTLAVTTNSPPPAPSKRLETAPGKTRLPSFIQTRSLRAAISRSRASSCATRSASEAKEAPASSP